MARFEVRATLTNKEFPFYYAELSHSVFVSQNNQELNRIPIRDFDGDEASPNYGLPQAYYMENVLPHTRGYNSLSFPEIVKPHKYEEQWLLADLYQWLQVNSDPESYLLVDDLLVGLDPLRVDDLHIIRATTATVQQTILYSPAGGGDVVYNPNAGGWNRFDTNPGFEGMVTVAQVQGQHYIFYEGIGCYKYDFDTNDMVEVTLTGVTAANLKGVCSGGLYLVVWDNQTVYWGGATFGTVTDFTPSLITGAGSTNLIGARSPITVAYPLADGFVAYTENNAVGAVYSGNDIAPWTFREIPGSAGILDSHHVSVDSNFDFHVAWTTSGFQQVSFRQATLIWAELSDSLSRGIYSERNLTTGAIERKNFNRADIKVNSLGARYTIISMREQGGIEEYQHAYVFDWSNSRWGRLRTPHTDFFDLRLPNLEIPVTYQELLDDEITYNTLLIDKTRYTDWDPQQIAQGLGDSFGVVRSGGNIFSAIQYLDVDDNQDSTIDNPSGATTPCIYLGNYKLTRGRSLLLQEMQIDSDFEGDIYAYSMDSSADIAHKVKVADLQHPNLTNRYLARFYGDSIGLSLHGGFNLSNLLLTFSGGGSRNAPRR